LSQLIAPRARSARRLAAWRRTNPEKFLFLFEGAQSDSWRTIKESIFAGFVSLLTQRTSRRGGVPPRRRSSRSVHLSLEGGSSGDKYTKI